MTSRNSGDRLRTPDEVVEAFRRLTPDKQKFVMEGFMKFIDGFKEMWIALKNLLAEYSTDWTMGDDGELSFTPVILSACPGCGRLFSDPKTSCFQPDPLKVRHDWAVRNCQDRGAIYANGESVDEVWGE